MSANPNEFHSFLTINENRSRILAVIISMVHDFELAEDLFQETVVEILKSESQFDPSRRFAPWACGVARNIVLRHWQRSGTSETNAVSEMISDLAQVCLEEDDEVWRHERSALRQCLKKLPPRAQNLLLLRYGQNMKGEELAQRAAYRQSSIRTTLLRLRQQMRQCVQTRLAGQ